MATVLIVSFGYLHATAPDADVTVDLRRAFRDPHVDPRMRELTGRDRSNTRNVTASRDLSNHGQTQTIPSTCAYPRGLLVRKRSVVFADRLARRLRRRGHTVSVTHRDIRRPVVQR